MKVLICCWIKTIPSSLDSWKLVMGNLVNDMPCEQYWVGEFVVEETSDGSLSTHFISSLSQPEDQIENFKLKRFWK